MLVRFICVVRSIVFVVIQVLIILVVRGNIRLRERIIGPKQGFIVEIVIREFDGLLNVVWVMIAGLWVGGILRIVIIENCFVIDKRILQFLGTKIINSKQAIVNIIGIVEGLGLLLGKNALCCNYQIEGFILQVLHLV